MCCGHDVRLFVGVIMIKEEPKELIDKKELVKRIINHSNQESYGATLNTSIPVLHVVEMIYEMPLESEKEAKWIWNENDKKWICSSCRMSCLYNSFGAPLASRCCSYCGWRMRDE